MTHRSSRRGTFLLMCMTLVATLTVLAFAFMRSVQSVHASGDATTRDLLSREAAVEGFHHASENLMRAYVSDPVNPIGPGFTRMDDQGLAPFTCINGAYAGGNSGTLGATSGSIDYDDVAPEHHIWNSVSAWGCADTNNDGRGRYYEPSFYNLAATAANPIAPTVPIAFTNLGLAALPDRADGLFLDQHFVRFPSTTPVLQARRLARYRQRYAVDIMDLDSDYLVNGDPSLDYTHITTTDPNDANDPNVHVDPVARRVIGTMEAIPQIISFMTWNAGGGYDMGSSGGLRMQHVFQGRGWASNFDWSSATNHTPVTFPLFFRDQNNPIMFLNGGWDSGDGWGRPNPPPEYAPHLYAATGTTRNAALGPLGLKDGGEAWPARASGYNGSYIMNHVFLGPQYSFKNFSMANYGGEGNVADFGGDGSGGSLNPGGMTPFGRHLSPGALQGSGACVSGDTGLSGTNTLFTQQIGPGDVISVGNEVRVVQGVLDDQDAVMTTPFSGTATGLAMALVTRYVSNASSPLTINILTAPVAVVNGILAGYCPSGVMKQTWVSGGADYATLYAYMSATPASGASPATYWVSSLSNVDPPPAPTAKPPIPARVTHSLGHYFCPSYNLATQQDFPIYYNPNEIRFTGGGPATEASATASVDASANATAGAVVMPGNITDGGSYSATPSVTVVEQWESNAAWDLFVPALSQAFGSGYGHYTQPQSSDAAGTVISPDFHVDHQRPADPRLHIPWPGPFPADVSTMPDHTPGPPYPPHPVADPGYRSPGDRYPGPLATNGFDDSDNPRHDRLGRFINVASYAISQDPYVGPSYPGAQFYRVGTCGMTWSPPTALTGPKPLPVPAPMNAGTANQWTQFGIFPELTGGGWQQGLAPHPDSFYYTMLAAMANAITEARAQWMLYPAWQCNPNQVFSGKPWKVGTNNNRVGNLHDLDALFLANLGIDINNPGAGAVYAGPVHFTNGTAPRGGGWCASYNILGSMTVNNNLATLVHNPAFTETIQDANNLPDNTTIDGTTATGAQLTETMELMLNDFRLSILGSSPGYQATFQALDFNGDGQVNCSAFPSAYNNPDFVADARGASASATEAALHIDQVVNATEAPFGSTTATSGAVTISSDPHYIPFSISGNFFIGKSKFFRVIVRGALWDNLRSITMSESVLDSAICLDPVDEAQELNTVPGYQHPARQYSSHVIYQRWLFDKYRGLMSRTY